MATAAGSDSTGAQQRSDTFDVFRSKTPIGNNGNVITRRVRPTKTVPNMTVGGNDDPEKDNSSLVTNCRANTEGDINYVKDG